MPKREAEVPADARPSSMYPLRAPEDGDSQASFPTTSLHQKCLSPFLSSPGPGARAAFLFSQLML